jgi:hypothetical protein
MDGTEQNDVSLGENLNIFQKRLKRHDELEEKVYKDLRGTADRQHLPDRRQSFAGIPCSWDLKTNVFVEDNSYDEYWRCWNEGEPIFLVYRNGDGDEYGDGELYADWLSKLVFSGPFEASIRSTCDDDYYRLSGGRKYEVFKQNLVYEIMEVKKHCVKQYITKILDWLIGNSYQ